MSQANDTYTHGHHEAVLRSHRWRTAENSAAYLLPHLRPGMSLLDVGCGPGTLTADLAARVAPGEVLAVDVSAEVIVEAGAHARRVGATNLAFRVGDFRAAGLAAGSFDVVHAHQVLQHLRDPVGALTEMRRLVRPGGVVAARDGDYSAMVWSPPDPLLDRWREIYLAVTRRNGAEANAGRRLLSWAREAGFQEIEYSTSNWTFATPEIAAGGRSCGPSARHRRPSPTRRSSTGSRPRRSWRRSQPPGDLGGRSPTPSSSSSAARSSPAAETDQRSGRASRRSRSPISSGRRRRSVPSGWAGARSPAGRPQTARQTVTPARRPASTS